MMNQAATYQRNLESSILFIQQEHANTLKALHEEIHSLQKKCSDLQFELHVTERPSGETGVSNTKDLEERIKESKELELKLRQEISHKNKRIQLLEHEMRQQKKRFLDEQRAHAQQINALKADLDVKSNSVAYLTTELHRIKLKQKMDLDSALDSSIRRTTQGMRVPAPPKDSPSKLNRSRVRRSSGLSADSDGLEKRPLRILSSKSSGSSRSESPDVSPFIARTELPTSVKTQPILPPISVQNRKPVIVHNVVHSAHNLSRKRAELSSPEISKLAVDQVSRTDASWGHAQESQSSEYN